MVDETKADVTKEATDRTVQAGPWQIHFQQAGAGHPVILLHGSGPGATGWSNFWKNIGPLADRFQVFALDMPGWGASSAVTREEFDHPAALLAFMDALGLEQAALVGNSMGGVTVLDFAIRYPDRVSHAITMGSGHMVSSKLFGAGDGPSEGLKALFQAYLTPTPEAMKNLVSIMCFDKSFATDELAETRSKITLSRPDHIQNFIDSLPKGGPIRDWFNLDDLNSLTVPTLLIHGRDDRVVPFEDSLAFVARIPNSRLVLINRCGHWAMIEHADEFNRMVIDFVENN